MKNNHAYAIIIEQFEQNSYLCFIIIFQTSMCKPSLINSQKNRKIHKALSIKISYLNFLQRQNIKIISYIILVGNYNYMTKSKNFLIIYILCMLPQGSENMERYQICQGSVIEHKRYYRFCDDCAKKNRGSVIYCMLCFKEKHYEHKDHLNHVFPLSTDQFKKMFRNFYHQISYYHNKFTQVSQHSLIKTINTYNYDDCFDELLSNPQFRTAAMRAQFWEFSSKGVNVAQKIQTLVSSLSIGMHVQIEPQPIVDSIEEQFRMAIDWGSESYRFLQEIQHSLQDAEKELQILQNQQYNIEILILINLVTNKKQKKDALEYLESQIEKNPKNWVLHLAKLNVLELHKENQRLWLPILETVCKQNHKFKESSCYHLLRSFRYWKKISKDEIAALKESASGEPFYVSHPITGSCFILENPSEFVRTLSEAIIQKKCAKNGLFYGYRAIGYLASNMLTQASKDFEKASMENSKLQSVASNKLFCKLKNHEQISEEEFLENIEQVRSKAYLVNAIKFFKSRRQYAAMLKSSQVMYASDKDNESSLITLIEALLKNNQVSSARSYLEKFKLSNPDKTRLNKIERKAYYTQGRKHFKEKNLDRAQEAYEKVTKIKESASSHYNLATVLYKNQNFTEAQNEINLALAIKQKSKYLQLKFHILLMKREFQAAKDLLSKLNPSFVGQEMRQFLDEETI